VRQRPVELQLNCPEKDAQISPYAHSYPQNCTVSKLKNHDDFHLRSSIFSKKHVYSFLFIPLHLSLPGCTKRLYFRGHNDKPVGKPISNALSIDAIVRKEQMHLLKATGSSFLHFKSTCAINGGGPPKFPSTRANAPLMGWVPQK